MNDLSRLLHAAEEGEARAAEELLPLVYDELRRLADDQMRAERPGQTLTATALVHEAWLRLAAGESDRPWRGRRHFVHAAALAMRRILVEQARRKAAIKRGGGREREDLDAVEIAAPESRVDLVALDSALDRLAAHDADAARLVQLRYFSGLTIAEAADAMGLAPRSADRLWAYARAWLYDDLSRADE